MCMKTETRNFSLLLLIWVCESKKCCQLLKHQFAEGNFAQYFNNLNYLSQNSFKILTTRKSYQKTLKLL